MTRCAAPLPFERLADYFAGDLPEADALQVEDHLFGCAACTEAAEAVQAVTADLRRFVAPVVTAARLRRLREAGTRIHETTVMPGGEADVHFRGDLDLLVHVLRADLTGVDRVDVELSRAGEPPFHTLEAVPFQAETGAVLVACQRHYGDMGYPEEMRFRLVAVERGTRRVLGEYLVRHHWT